jgi:hypothetical protein
MINKIKMKNTLILIINFSCLLFLVLVSCNTSVKDKNNVNVIVQLSFPSESIPPLNVYLKDVNTNKVYLYKNYDGSSLINFKDIPNGEYIAFAYTKDYIIGTSKAKGGYTCAVDCGLTVDCKDISIKKINISNEFNDTLKIFDWYNENYIPNEPQIIFKTFPDNKGEYKETRINESKSLADIRSLVISGAEHNLLKRLGEPDEELSAYNFLDKYYHNKFNIDSFYWGSAIRDSEIFVYNNLSDKPIIVVYDSRNDEVHEVLFLNDVTSINDVATR